MGSYLQSTVVGRVATLAPLTRNTHYFREKDDKNTRKKIRRASAAAQAHNAKLTIGGYAPGAMALGANQPTPGAGVLR